MSFRNERVLLRAFEAAEYRVTLPGGAQALVRVGQASPLEAALAEAGASSFCIVTAFNPGGVARDAPLNEAAQRALDARLSDAGLSWWPARNQAPGGGFVEPSRCVLGLDPAQAAAWGRAFGQVAVVWGEVGQAPRLVRCAPDA